MNFIWPFIDMYLNSENYHDLRASMMEVFSCPNQNCTCLEQVERSGPESSYKYNRNAEYKDKHDRGLLRFGPIQIAFIYIYYYYNA